ncbi:XRE family transcriptional regulator [Pseudoalteromonas phenolica]|nr:XRE family transcriptional regulator [Pseudoalteromonas phenolica]
MVCTMKAIFEPNYRKLVGWLTAERKFRKCTQPQLAEKLGFPNSSYISKIENFERKLDVNEYVKICQVLELDPHEGIDILLKPSPDTRRL